MSKNKTYLKGLYGLCYMSYLLIWGLCNKYCYTTLHGINDFFLFRYINLFLSLMAIGGLLLAGLLLWKNTFTLCKIKKILIFSITSLCVITISFIFGAKYIPLALWYPIMFIFNLCSSLYAIAIFGLVPALQEDSSQHPIYYSSLYIGIGLAMVLTQLIINSMTVNMTIIIYLIGALIISAFCHYELTRALPTDAHEQSSQNHRASQLFFNKEIWLLMITILIVALAESMGRDQVHLGFTSIQQNILAIFCLFTGTLLFYGANRLSYNKSILFITGTTISGVSIFLAQFVHNSFILLLCQISMGVCFIIIDLVLITHIAHLTLKLQIVYGFASLGLLYTIPTGANTIVNRIKPWIPRIVPMSFLYFMLPTLLLLLGLVLYIYSTKREQNS